MVWRVIFKGLTHRTMAAKGDDYWARLVRVERSWEVLTKKKQNSLASHNMVSQELPCLKIQPQQEVAFFSPLRSLRRCLHLCWEGKYRLLLEPREQQITRYTYSNLVLQDANGSTLSLKRVTISQGAVGGWRATPVPAQPVPIGPHAIGAAFLAGM